MLVHDKAIFNYSGLEDHMKNTTRVLLYVALYLSQIGFVVLLWVVAGLSLCGISGCSGGGYGVNYDPTSVQLALIASGVAGAVAPAVIFFISKYKWWWLVIAIVTFFAVPLIGALLIGAGLDGYPINRNG